MTNNWFLLEARNKTSIEIADTKSPSNRNRCCAKICFPAEGKTRKRRKNQSRPIISEKGKKTYSMKLYFSVDEEKRPRESSVILAI